AGILLQLEVDFKLTTQCRVLTKNSVCVWSHRAQLERVELSARSNNSTPIQHPTAILRLDDYGQNCDERKGQKKKDRGAKNINSSLQERTDTAKRGCNQ